MSLSAAAVVKILSPSIALGSALLAALPWLRRDQMWARTGLLVLTVGLMWYYIFWRLTDTLPPIGFSADFFVGIVFALIETFTMLGLTLSHLTLTRISNRTAEVEANRLWFNAQAAPTVDVCICTYNEDQAILERTIAGALAMDYPNFRVWVLDDGRRDWLKALCSKKGAQYLTRPDNSHAKAGNINNALALLARLDRPPDFITILDADFVPIANFLSRTLPLFRKPDVGIVQTPQHFINPDPIQANLSATHVWPDEQRHFFDIVMPSKDAWGVAFCCGTSAVIRYSALSAIGGFPTDSITEDCLLTLRLQKAGYRTVYLNEKLSLGLAPEGLKEYMTQRTRWCLGFMQICRGPSGPLKIGSDLPLLQRLSLVDGFLYWSAGYMYRLLCLAVPIAYWLFGINAVHADVYTALSHFVPFFVAQSLTMGWITSGRMLPLMGEISQLLVAPEILRAVAVGLAKPRGHTFSVTAKGALREKRVYQWRLLLRFAFLLGLTVAGVILGWITNNGEALDNAGALCLFWSWYNIVLLISCCVVCIEQPRYRKDERFPAHEIVTLSSAAGVRTYPMLDCSLGGMRLAGEAPAPLGSKVGLRFSAAHVNATIVRAAADSFALQLEGESAHELMIRYLYSGRLTRGATNVRGWRVLIAVLQRLFR